MKYDSQSLATKIWLTVIVSIMITVLFSYILSHLFYEKIYVENLEKTLLSEGKRLAMDYEGGPLNQDLKKQIQWYNSKNQYEVFAVGSPKELAACLPFDSSHSTLITQEDREMLLQGHSVQKMGFEERFNRKILAVIIPLLDENRLEGIIYLYVPLAKISELTNEFAVLWLIAAFLFLAISVYLGSLLVRKLTLPLQGIREATQKLSQGDYSVRVPHISNDEIGQLANAFNHMSSSMQKEDEMRRDFLANVSHELRTPLSYVNGYSEALLSDIVLDESEKKKYLSLIHRESKRMERIVGDLLDLAKLENVDMELIKTPLPLAQLIEDSTQKYKYYMEEREIQLNLHLDPELIILGDEGRLEQVLQNVMDNALKYTEEGSITLTLLNDKGMARLKVEDTGAGIPELDLRYIKERFYRVNKARTRNDGGTGLGLAICDSIIKHHGGELNISSTIGVGTVIEIVLPIIELENL